MMYLRTIYAARDFLQKGCVLLFIAFSFFGSQAAAPAASRDIPGMLWAVQGAWNHEDGKEVASGASVLPGELLRPSLTDGMHQAIVLLPDGQRLLYQCFDSKDCARGFRIPVLNARPSAFAIDMLNRMRSEQATQRAPLSGQSGMHAVPAALDELVATLMAGGTVRLTGLAATLPEGHYSYELVRIDQGAPQHSTAGRLPLQKPAGPALLALPGAGLYDIRISDSFGVQRIQLRLLAIAPGDGAPAERFAHALGTLRDWNEKSPGWPIHPLLRLYLLSLAESPTKRS
jgi:hypothetical protein